MEDTERLMAVIEGFCPDCECQMTPTNWGAVESCRDWFEFGPEVPFSLWTYPPDGDGPTVGVEYECPHCHRKYYVERNHWGDWA